MKIFPCIPWAETICPQELPTVGWTDVPNLGQAYNEIMAALPDGAWACLMDHDVMFTTRVWYSQLCRAVAQQPQGTFVPYVYRGGAPWQQIHTVRPDVPLDVHDIRYHRQLGTEIVQFGGDKLLDMTDHEPLGGGQLILLSKANWEAVKGFDEGCLYVDHKMFRKLRDTGLRTYLMHGIYLYHWKRAAGECHPALVYDNG